TCRFPVTSTTASAFGPLLVAVAPICPCAATASIADIPAMLIATTFLVFMTLFFLPGETIFPPGETISSLRGVTLCRAFLCPTRDRTGSNLVLSWRWPYGKTRIPPSLSLWQLELLAHDD